MISPVLATLPLYGPERLGRKGRKVQMSAASAASTR